MSDLKKKLKLLEIAQKLKKNTISYLDAKEEIINLDKKDFVCCDHIKLETTRCKYPNGLPITTINITYCSNCDNIHDVVW